jgi:hypothetical protein
MLPKAGKGSQPSDTDKKPVEAKQSSVISIKQHREILHENIKTGMQEALTEMNITVKLEDHPSLFEYSHRAIQFGTAYPLSNPADYYQTGRVLAEHIVHNFLEGRRTTLHALQQNVYFTIYLKYDFQQERGGMHITAEVGLRPKEKEPAKK